MDGDGFVVGDLLLENILGYILGLGHHIAHSLCLNIVSACDVFSELRLNLLRGNSSHLLLNTFGIDHVKEALTVSLYTLVAYFIVRARHRFWWRC